MCWRRSRMHVLACSILVLGVGLVPVAGCAPSVDAMQREGDIDGLHERLDSEAAPQVRADAAIALGTLGVEQAFDPLVDALTDTETDTMVRAAAATGLGALGMPEAIRPLLTAAGDVQSEVRAAAEKSLDSLLEALDGAVASAALVDPLADEKATIRAAAARAFGAVISPEAIRPLLLATGDPVPEVRKAADASLGSVISALGAPDAVRPLLLARRDGSLVVADAANQALLELLSGMGDELAVGALLEALDDERPEITEEADLALRQEFSRIGMDRALAVVRSQGAGDAWLAALGAQAACAALAEGLADGSEVVRAAAAATIGTLGHPDAVRPLLLARRDGSLVVADVANQALVELLSGMEDELAVGALFGALDDERPEITEEADLALRQEFSRIGTDRALAVVRSQGAGDVWLAAALGVPEESLASETRLRGIELEPLGGIQSAAATVLNGTPVAGARPYAPSDAFHPAVVMASGTARTPWPGDIPLPWSVWGAPTALRFLELVVIVDDVVWDKIETCLYNGPSITRYRATQTVRVVAASDGRLIEKKTFGGVPPRACLSREPYDLTELRGTEPYLGTAVPWLETIIHPPTY